MWSRKRKVTITRRLTVKLLLIIFIMLSLLSLNVLVTGFSSPEENRRTSSMTESPSMRQDRILYLSSSEPSDRKNTSSQSSSSRSTEREDEDQLSINESSSSKYSPSQSSTSKSAFSTSDSLQTSNENTYQEDNKAANETSDSLQDETFNRIEATEEEVQRSSGTDIWIVVLAIFSVLSFIGNFVFFLQYNKLNSRIRTMKSDTNKYQNIIIDLDNKFKYMNSRFNEYIENAAGNASASSGRQNTTPPPNNPIRGKESNDQTSYTVNSFQPQPSARPAQSQPVSQLQPQNPATSPQTQPVRPYQPRPDGESLLEYCRSIYSDSKATSPLYKYNNAGIVDHNENSFGQKTYFATMQEGEAAARFLLIMPSVENKYALIPKIRKSYSIQDLELYRSAYNFRIPASGTGDYKIDIIKLAFLQIEGNRYILIEKGELSVENY